MTAKADRSRRPWPPRAGQTAALVLSGILSGAAALAQDVQVTVAGGDAGLTDAVRGASLAVELAAAQGTDTPQTPQDYIAAARADYRRILTALYARGHYAGEISIRVDGQEASGIAPLDAPARIGGIEIAVDPGPVFAFGTVGIAPVPEGTALPEGLASGETARAELIRSATRDVVLAWRDLGHAKAEPAGQEITAIHAERRLDAIVTIDPGPRLTFGPLTVAGNDAVRADRIAWITGLREGRVFSPAELDLAALRLRRTGAFASVALIEADAIGPGDTLPITAQVSENPPRRFGFGAELSSVDGLSVNAFWLHRNFFGGAERLRIEGTVSDIEGTAGGPDYELSLSFGRPGTFNPDTDLTFDAAIARADEPDYLLDQISATLGFTKYVREDLDYTAALGIVTAREETPFRTRDYTLVTLPLTATLDRRDDPLNARDGYYIDVQATPFAGVTGTDSGARLYADARAYRTFGERVTVAGRVQLGSVLGADLLDAPPDYLFYSGGGGTVRGQPYNDLGIDISRDFGAPGALQVGGRSFAGAQIEARVRVTGAISAVGFYDFGAIDIDSFPTEDALTHAGLGLGLRYDTGIGPIRVDIGTPASGDDAFEEAQIYIGIGQAF